MKTIKLPDGAVVEVPNEADSLEKALIYVRDTHGMEAYKSALNATQNIPAPPPDVPDALLSWFLQHDKTLSDLGRGAMNVTGIGPQTSEAEFAEEERLFKPVQEAHPFATGVGRLTPYASAGGVGGGLTKGASALLNAPRGLPMLAGVAEGAGLGAADPQGTALEGALMGGLGSGAASALEAIPSREFLYWAKRNQRKATQYIQDALKPHGITDLSIKSLEDGKAAAGREMNAIARPDVMVNVASDALADIIEKSRRGKKGVSKKLEALYNQGTIPADELKAFITDLTAKGGSAKGARKALQSSLYEAAPDLKNVDARYSLLSTLRKPGMVDGGKLNVGRFSTELDKKYPKLVANPQDPVLRVAQSYADDSQRFTPRPKISVTDLGSPLDIVKMLGRGARDAGSLGAKGLNQVGRAAQPLAPAMTVGATQGGPPMDPSAQAIGPDVDTMRLLWQNFISSQFPGGQR